MSGHTLESMIREAAGRLAQVSDSPRIDASTLAKHAFGLDAAGLIRDGNTTPPASNRLHFQNFVSRRLDGEPVAYITGKKEFWSLQLDVSRAVLIPRPDTELLVEVALGFLGDLDSTARVLDLGTGSGAVALAIAHDVPDASILATDVSAAALDVARGNAGHLDIASIRFAHSDWFNAIDGTFHLIVSNPPYVADDDPHLSRGDVACEPRHALSAGPDGLDDLDIIIARSHGFLVPGGMLAVEHGNTQGSRVRALFSAAGFSQIKTHRDIAGLERISSGHREATV